MIELVGPNMGSEREAADSLRKGVLGLWSDLQDDPDDRVRIHAAAKIYGYKVQDIDILLVAAFGQRREFRPTAMFRPREGEPLQPRWAGVTSLLLAIEVKGHDANHVRFHGATAEVRYRRAGAETWENASEQSLAQVHALRAYLKDQGIAQVWVTGLVLFPNLRERDLPPRPHNIIAGDSSFERLLNVLGEIAQPWVQGQRATLSAAKPETMQALLNRSLFTSLEPTPLDRRRMDRIVKQEAHQEGWFQDLGERALILRGRGGAGKTVIMLQLAHRAWDENGARSLILTYNRALTADLERILALMGIGDDLGRGGIEVGSVMAFIRAVLDHFGLVPEIGFLESYGELCSEMAQMLENGTVTADEIAAMKTASGARFAFDQVFVDEGQDWPRAEIAILRALYPPQAFVVADGVDQFVRGQSADWEPEFPKALRRVRRLRRCLRMKANLARFAKAFAQEIGLYHWSVEPVAEAGGGRVVVIQGDYFADLAAHDRLVAEARAAGNAPVDLLCCVPPSLGTERAGGLEVGGAARFRAHGAAVWDGTLREDRMNFPTDVQQLRIVQYESCRGLEGWIVFALSIDELWDNKLRWADTEGDPQLALDREEAARQAAARWLMIPLTRAIDTLVLNVTEMSSEIGQALLRLNDVHGDFMEWTSGRSESSTRQGATH